LGTDVVVSAMSREWYPESVLLTRAPEHHGFAIRPFNETKNEDFNIKRMVSDKKKLFFDNSEPYGHILTIWLDVILEELSSTEDKFVILFPLKSVSHHQSIENTGSLTNYLEKRFISLGHEVEYLDSDSIVVNNLVFYVPGQVNSVESVSRTISFLSDGLDRPAAPTKKIYLSRGKTTTHNGNVYVPIPKDSSEEEFDIVNYRKNNQYKFSNRIDNEKLVEDYFIKLGFAVVYPEDMGSFDEQLLLFASCKIVVSLTSSSLTTCFVMAPNTCVVELSTPLEDGAGVPHVHTHYKMFSDVGSKNYLSIPHSRRAFDLIESIENSPAVKSFLLS
jgi:hypothetical protein